MSRPHFDVGSQQLPGVIAVVLFAVMAWVFLNAGFGEPAGFPAGESVVAAIGWALIGVTDGPIPSESFMAALIIIALVLDAALDGAVHLARREDRPTAAEGGGEMQ